MAQVTVNSDQTITLNAAAARPYHASLATPVTASARIDRLNVYRGSVTGGSCGNPVAAQLGMGLYSYAYPGQGFVASTLSATPTQPVTEGSFGFDASTVLDTGPASDPPSGPTYFLDFPDSGSVPSSLADTVSHSDLTTVKSQLYASPQAGSGHLIGLGTDLHHPWDYLPDLSESVGDQISDLPSQSTGTLLGTGCKPTGTGQTNGCIQPGIEATGT